MLKISFTVVLPNFLEDYSYINRCIGCCFIINNCKIDDSVVQLQTTIPVLCFDFTLSRITITTDLIILNTDQGCNYRRIRIHKIC